MKKLLILLFPIACYSQKDSTIDFSFFRAKVLEANRKDSTAITQETFFSFGIYHLLTTDFSLYNNVVHGSKEFVESQKTVEYDKALRRRKTITIVTAKCK